MAALRNAYYITFYVLYRCAVLERKSSVKEWTALLAISMLDSWVLVLLDAGYWRVFGARWLTDLPKPSLLVVFAGVVALNHWAILRKGRWKAYERTFAGYSATGKVLRVGAVVLFIALLLGAMFWFLPGSALQPPLRTRTR